MMIDQKQPRDYIARLRRDPRLKAMMDGWVHQATIEAEQRYDFHRDRPAKIAHFVAERAVQLAMSFVLDNDGEHQMVLMERDKLLENAIKLHELGPRPLFISGAPSPLAPPPQPE